MYQKWALKGRRVVLYACTQPCTVQHSTLGTRRQCPWKAAPYGTETAVCMYMRALRATMEKPCSVDLAASPRGRRVLEPNKLLWVNGQKPNNQNTSRRLGDDSRVKGKEDLGAVFPHEAGKNQRASLLPTTKRANPAEAPDLTKDQPGGTMTERTKRYEGRKKKYPDSLGTNPLAIGTPPAKPNIQSPLHRLPPPFF